MWPGNIAYFDFQIEQILFYLEVTLVKSIPASYTAINPGKFTQSVNVPLLLIILVKLDAFFLFCDYHRAATLKSAILSHTSFCYLLWLCRYVSKECTYLVHSAASSIDPLVAESVVLANANVWYSMIIWMQAWKGVDCSCSHWNAILPWFKIAWPLFW